MNFCEKETGRIFTELLLKYRGMPTEKLDIMRRSGFYPVEYDYIQYDKLVQKQEPIKPLLFDEDKQVYHQLFEALPLSDEELQQNLEILSNILIEYIDDQTSRDILSGFDAVTQDTVLHFSYDEHDQTNFVSKQLQILTGSLQEKKISWKSYKIIKDEDGNPIHDVKGELVPLLLTPEEFTNIYNQAVYSASTKLTLGEKKKQDIANAESIEEIRLLLEEYGISEDQLLAGSSTWQSIKEEKTS